MHDAGKMLNPLIADGQVHGAFVQGVAAALYEESSTTRTALPVRHLRRLSGADGQRDPKLEILHIRRRRRR